MKFFAPVLALATLLTTTAAAPIADAATGISPNYQLFPRLDVGLTTLAAYDTASCTAIRSVNVVTKKGTCSKLISAARGIKFQLAVPSACTVFGYDSTNCSGQQLFSVRGPSNAKTCYATSSAGGVNKQIQSVQLIC